MPNYRIPNNSNNDANGMWKLNAVQRAREGGEWPDPYVPYTPSQYYIETSSGYSTSITDGTSTNSGAANTGYSTWGYSAGWYNADSMGFSHQYNGSSAANYKLNKISIGSGNGSWDNSFANIYWRAKIYTGFGTATNTIIYDSDWVSTAQGSNTIMGLNFASTAYGVGYMSFFMLLLPDGTGSADPLPTLSWNTGYTIAFAYGSTSGGGFSFTNRTGNRVITLTDGSQVTQNHFATQNSMSDSSPFGSSNGTDGSSGGYGQFPVLGYII